MRTIVFLLSSGFLLLLVAASHFELPRIAKSAGYTTTAQNTAKVNPAFNGVLLALNVKDKTKVLRGQVLGEVTSERFILNRSVDEAQANLALKKKTLANSELNNVDMNEKINHRSTQLRIKTTANEIANLAQEISLAGQRVTNLETQFDRQSSLQKQGFVSIEAVEQKRNELLQQKLTHSALSRSKMQLERDIATQQEELNLIKSRSLTQRSQLNREIVTSEQEFNEHSAKRLQLIAPIDGVVTQVSASVGQTVKAEFPIMTIVPEGGAAEVLLLIPSRSIGFMRLGQKVSVRFQAYAYEHYGRQYGLIKEISAVALPPQEVVQHIRVDEPVYTVRVSLPTNYLEYQGKQLPISPGMVVEADVELDRLKIYQWLLEPLYRLGGRL